MAGDPIPIEFQAVVSLLNLNFSTSFFEGFLESVSFVLGNTFLNGLRSVVDELFGLFEAEASEILDSLHDAKFLGLIGHTLEDNVEGGLLFGSSGATSGGSSGNSNSGCSGFDAVFLFQDVS